MCISQKMALTTDDYRIAFCQVTKELPEYVNKLIWVMSLPDPVCPSAPKKSRESPFESWMSSINSILFDTHGVNVGDLPDEPFMDYFEEGLGPCDVML